MTKTLYVYLLGIVLFAGCSTSAEQIPKSDTPKQIPAADMPKGSNVNPDAGLVADFKRKVDDYVKLREEAEKNAPAMKDKDR
jgi:hypothetical protein